MVQKRTRPSRSKVGEKAFPVSQLWDRWDSVLLLLFWAAALFLFGWRIQVPPEYIYDEVYHAYTANQYALGNKEAYEWWTTAPQEGVAYGWVQPPLGKLLIAGGIVVFGNNSFGWRVASLLFGSAVVPAAYLLCRRLVDDRLTAMLSTLLLLFEGLLFVQSRVAMLDSFATLFIVISYGLMFRFLTSSLEAGPGQLLPLGIVLGLGIATKWNVFYALGMAGLFLAYRLWAIATEKGRSREERRQLTGRHLSSAFFCLVLLPLAIYLLSYAQFFALGHTISQFVELQGQMWIYNSQLQATHAYASRWWSWPLMIRPVWYYVGHAAERVAHVYARGNPLIWWAFLPAIAAVLWDWWPQRKAGLGIILLAFCGQWLPWMFSPRITFFQHMLPSVPFACMALGYTLSKMAKMNRAWLAIAAIYLAVVILAFVYFYPITAAWPISPEAFEARMWLPSWR